MHVRSMIAMIMGLCIIQAAAQPVVRVVERPAPEPVNRHYATNRPPLEPSVFITLPFGAIEPQGWLQRQLRLQADGFFGHLDEISSFCRPQGNAWLDPDGRGGSGWEEVPYWLRGHVTTGYLLNDKDIMEQVEPWIENVLESQREDGYLGPRSNLNANGVHDLMPNQNIVWVLRAFHEYTGDERVIDALTRYYKWQSEIPDNKFFAGGWGQPRNADDMESVHWLYNHTGEAWLLEHADKLRRTGRSWMDAPTAGHNVDLSMGFRKPGQFYPQSRNPAHLAQAYENFDTLYGIYGQVPGGMFGGDEFARPGYTDPRQAIEACGVAEMLISQGILLRISGDPVWADRAEDAAFNSLPATMTDDLKGLRYLTSPNQVNSDARSKAPGIANLGPMQVMNPHYHRCCQHNIGAAWPYFAQNLWTATPGNGVAAMMYAPSRLKARVGDGVDVVITQDTQYPFDGTITFTVDTPRAVRFPFTLRVPAWCEAPQLALNGRPLAVEAAPGSYIQVDHTWAPGDQLTLDLPMEVRVRTWEQNKDSVTVYRGPIAFSLFIGERYEPYHPDRFRDPWPAFEIHPATPWNFALDYDENDIAGSFQVVEREWPEDHQVFSHAGAPIGIRATARRLPNWQEDHQGLVDVLQQSPVRSDAPRQTVALIPMGAARLRLTALPVIGDGPEWRLPEPPLVSYSRGKNDDPYGAMFDGHVPDSSSGRGARFTTYSFGGSEHGKLHWVRRNFDEPTVVSSTKVFWVDESPRNGDVRLPKWWKVLYLDADGEWREVENASGYGVEADIFNEVTFKPVRTSALRLDVQTLDDPRRYAMGIFEWVIGKE